MIEKSTFYFQSEASPGWCKLDIGKVGNGALEHSK